MPPPTPLRRTISGLYAETDERGRPFRVRIVATLDEGMSYVQGTGATQPTVSGATITFAPLAVVEAKAEAVWNLRIKATGAGDKRFKISMTTKALGRPVEETEATNIYE